MAQLKDTFIDYFNDISTELTSASSNFQKQIDLAELQFQRFGLTNEQISTFMVEVNKEAIKTFAAYASSSSIELIKIEEASDLADKEIELKEKQIELADKELALKDKEMDLTDKKIELITAQIKTEAGQEALLESQKDLVDRQIQGYDDNLLVKAAEFQGGLASFAINSAPENPTTAIAINNFTCLIEKLESLSRNATASCTFPAP